MENIKLQEITTIISRGYNYLKVNNVLDSNTGRATYIVDFKDIENNKIACENKIFLKNNENIFEKYCLSAYDIILPPSINANIKVKCIAETAKNIMNKEPKYSFPLILYSQNVVFIRLSKPAGNYMLYEPHELATLLNTEIMKQKLINTIYSNNKVILIDKLRHFEIPYPTEELKLKLREIEECQKNFTKLNNEIENFIK